MISLTKFSKDNNLAKATVYRRCQELGIDTSAGLSDEAIATLTHEFDLMPVSPTSPVTVEVGNHALTLAAPQLPQQYSLETLRAGEVVSFDDPLAIAQQFLTAADGLQTAMQQDIEARQARLQQTQQAKDAIANKRRELELEARLYQMQTQQIDASTTAETQKLQEELAALQRLGKPSEPSPSQPQS
ncbi:hypothetical protein ACQ4M4_25850 [Leptolyngbya sp. AN02str]|uniref:hypothetical protein n=1 Tax=Leptolyngbya sp. AN02str TaxID=3423363 RepID=UPI003D31D0C8